MFKVCVDVVGLDEKVLTSVIFEFPLSIPRPLSPPPFPISHQQCGSLGSLSSLFEHVLLLSCLLVIYLQTTQKFLKSIF